MYWPGTFAIAKKLLLSSVLRPIAIAMACFVAGYIIKGRIDAANIEHLHGEIAHIEARYAVERQAAAEEAARRLAAAEEAERAAVHALHATRTKLTATNRRLKEALNGLSTRNNCGMSDAAVSMLNNAIRGAADLPEGTAEPYPAAAGATADPARPAASEAAIGKWIAEAAALYDECRARIDAIRQWDASLGSREE